MTKSIVESTGRAQRVLVLVCFLTSLLLSLFHLGCKNSGANNDGLESSAASQKLGDQPPDALPSAVMNPDLRVSRISISSCIDQNRSQKTWNKVLTYKPDIHLAIGENVRASTPATRPIAKAYAKLLSAPEFANFRTLVPMIPIIDDHDAGVNDADSTNPYMAEARAEYLKFWTNVPDEVRQRTEGLYSSYLLGPEGQRLQIILLDVRTFRSPWQPIPSLERGKYVVLNDTSKTILGETQWNWLAGELKKKADLRLLVSPIQILSEEHPFEKWGNFPHEKARLLELIAANDKVPTVLITGDRHHGEISQLSSFGKRKLIEITSSSFNLPGSIRTEKNRFRVGPIVSTANFGVFDIDWTRQKWSSKILSPDGQIKSSIESDFGKSFVSPKKPAEKTSKNLGKTRTKKKASSKKASKAPN